MQWQLTFQHVLVLLTETAGRTMHTLREIQTSIVTATGMTALTAEGGMRKTTKETVRLVESVVWMLKRKPRKSESRGDVVVEKKRRTKNGKKGAGEGENESGKRSESALNVAAATMNVMKTVRGEGIARGVIVQTLESPIDLIGLIDPIARRSVTTIWTGKGGIRGVMMTGKCMDGLVMTGIETGEQYTTWLIVAKNHRLISKCLLCPNSPRRRTPPPPRRRSPLYEAPPRAAEPRDEALELLDEAASEARSVFVSQLAGKLTSRDVGMFFEHKLGPRSVRDSRVVTDRITRRSKGYVLLIRSSFPL